MLRTEWQIELQNCKRHASPFVTLTKIDEAENKIVSRVPLRSRCRTDVLKVQADSSHNELIRRKPPVNHICVINNVTAENETPATWITSLSKFYSAGS
jgi:hypothetical protein